ncbi:hypothetical protein L6164_031067 [Bauhinia variegata]|uniref:Uncharacterized protein n=1 Tax=Bauhinia variegata TaxID=167791 RepID=A0ACB9LES9_BAUVA|nr:hypothetical protein L6164_031067 [Bauhinia variegata]
MDATPSSELTEPVVDGSPASEKRPIENGGGEELGDRSSKKAKVGDSGELKRVAEIVLVLSTMAAMRGGKKPTDVENELMMEARAKLADLCQGLAPKDIVAREAIGTVIEDLGLNGKVKDQRLGFRAPKMSISERFSHAKWKMEEAKKYSAHSATYSSQPLQTSTSGTVENRMPSHAVRMFPSDKSSHAAISSASTLASTPVSQVSSALHYPSSSNEIRAPIVTSGMPSNHLGRNSSSLTLPKTEQPQFKADGGSNGSPYMLQVQANSSANQPNAPTWSIQSQSATSARTGPDNKVPGHTSVKVEGTGNLTVSRAAPQIPRDQSFRPFITQTAPGNLSTVHQPLQGMNIVQPPSVTNNHTEIAKIVQKFLQPKLPEHPTWTPPSRDYMSKATTCQMCELTVNEVDTVLLCDACEKAFHLKCLQSLRGIPRGEWHCMRCLTLSNGKPLPPKYGRVMRSSNMPNTPPKVPSNTGGIQASLERKAGVLDTKVGQEKLTTNGSSAPTRTTGNSSTELPSDSKTLVARDIQGDSITSSSKHIGEKPGPSISTKSLDGASNSSASIPGEISSQQIKNSEAFACQEGEITSETETPPKLSVQILQDEQTVLQDDAEGSSYKLPDDSLIYNNQKESLGEGLRYDIQRDSKDVALGNSGSSGTSTDGRQHSQLPTNGSHVQWIGDVIQVVDEKKFYQSCCVDGVTYRLKDHALFISNLGQLEPSKLQSMWEDSKTGLKWVNVTKCYFPGDLPGNIAHPCISEVNEVYESNSDRTEMAASIRGPCGVLPSNKFKQETDRRNQLGLEASARLHPIFLCRWFYDELKKLFQPVTS